jgi:hypothetical protein
MQKLTTIVYRIPIPSKERKTAIPGIELQRAERMVNELSNNLVQCTTSKVTRTIDSKVESVLDVTMIEPTIIGRDISQLGHAFRTYIGLIGLPDFVPEGPDIDLLRGILGDYGHALLQQSQGYLVVPRSAQYVGDNPRAVPLSR